MERGEIWLVSLDPTAGHEQQGTRPVLIVRHCCKVSDEAAFCLIQRPYISKTLLTRRISPR
ncbi:type II toxin-antitoxin system PemK/MazF family toxin, partial [Escherichia coli]|uniref:type II toxin-antitoxin system PemK/MazF family toxin n=1 Tax=Escherichia coli TaxID=562 RepID=UPI00039103C1